jgi:hypothetical protein
VARLYDQNAPLEVEALSFTFGGSDNPDPAKPD